jgi:hypothetical protein
MPKDKEAIYVIVAMLEIDVKQLLGKIGGEIF